MLNRLKNNQIQQNDYTRTMAYLRQSSSNPGNHHQIGKLIFVVLKTCLQIILHVVGSLF